VDEATKTLPEPPPTRRTPTARAAEASPSVLTRLLRAPFVALHVVLSPVGYFFRIREPLGVFWQVALPLAFIAALFGVWTWATTGETYVVRLASASPLDAWKAPIERALGVPVKVETARRERKIFTGEKKVWYEVTALVVPAQAYEAHKAELPKLLKGEEFTAEAGAAGEERIVAKASFGRVDDIRSEYEVTRARLAAGLEGAKFVERPAPADDVDRRVTIERIVVAKAVFDLPIARRTLDALIGEGSYVAAETPEGVAISGIERVEERKISAALVPSPREMADSIPSLLNLKWTTWQDAANWWKTGTPEKVDRAEAAPVTISWGSPNEAPFQLADALFSRLIGPHWKDWKLLHAVTWSTIRIFMGFLWATLIAVPLGVVMGSFGKPRAFFQPLILIGSYLPIPALLSLTVFWWGLTESQKIGFLTIVTFVVLLPQVVMAIEAIPQEHIAAARTLGATRWQQMRRVLLGGAKADIMRSLRLSFAVGWTWIILAESIDPKAGLGYVIQLGERRPAHRPHIYVVILLIIAIAYVVNTIWARVERRLFPYRATDA
jgi:NitT/TauT family transport system permease protein